jgi:hypothetical protein
MALEINQINFNKKYKRTGSLFEGKFKSKYIDKENYFQDLTKEMAKKSII